MPASGKRGFGSMDEAKQREIASKGGQAAHLKGSAHEFSQEEARQAVSKGGKAAHEKGSAHDEEDGWRLAAIASLDGLVDDGADRVGALRRGNRALGPCKLYGGVKDSALRVGNAFDVAMIDECRYQRRHAVIAQTTGVDAVRNEIVAERVHLYQRRHLSGVAKVVGVFAAGDRRTRLRLRGEEPRLGSPLQPVAQEREGQSGEVTPATDAADNDVRHRLGALHLQQRLLPDDRLVHQHMVEDAAE